MTGPGPGEGLDPNYWPPISGCLLLLLLFTSVALGGFRHFISTRISLKYLILEKTVIFDSNLKQDFYLNFKLEAGL